MAFEVVTSASWPSIAIIGAIAAITYALYRFLLSPYRLLSDHGIKGPQPLPVLGNYLSIMKVGHVKFLEEHIQKYGLVFGYYVGKTPHIAIADVELAKEILVKEFDNFSDRGLSGHPSAFRRATGLALGMFAFTVETWRPTRQALTPTFSGMKMKLMVPLVKKSSDVLLEIVRELAESGKSVNIHKVYGAFTMETLIATAFGQYSNVQRGEADGITDGASAFFRSSADGSAISSDLLMAVLSNLPWLEPLVEQAIRKSEVAKHIRLMQSTAIKLIEERQKSKDPPEVKDLLQSLLEAQDKIADDSATASKEIAGLAFDFLLAGYEGTSNTLSYTTHLLAMHPDVQEKLQAEIDQYFEDNPEASLYEATQNLKYLDMVIQESMRQYTSAPKTMRWCYKTVTVGGVTIPKGVLVVFPVNYIHHMAQYWPDPYKFDPERYSPEARAARPHLAHMPFGWGPRNCIGLRFALLEMKIALIEILRKYTFAQAPETVAKLEQIHGFTSVPKNGVIVKITPRRK